MRSFSEYKRSLLPTKEELRLWAKTPIAEIPYNMAVKMWVKGARYERAMLGLPIEIFNTTDSKGDLVRVEVYVSTAELNVWGYLDDEILEWDDDYSQDVDFEEVNN
jgi:hypothetical protein